LISVARSPVRWDIVEEHLDEAAFLWTQWEHALVSPRYTLADVADGPEERLKAHVDGLVVGREPVAERLLIPALAHDEPEYRFAAASALLASGERAPRAAVLDALAAAGGPALAALARAFALHASSETTQALLERWPALPPPARSVVLEACVRTGADPGARLDAVMREGEAPTLGAGLEATRRIREQSWGRTMTIIALTGWGQEHDREQSRAAGCNGHLVKPVSLPDLQKLMRELFVSQTAG